MKYIKHVILLVCLSTMFVISVNAISIRGLLGLDEEESKTEAVSADKSKVESAKTAPRAAENNWAKSNALQAKAKVDYSLLKQIIANVAPAQRDALLANADAFRKMVRQEAGNLSVISAARANNLQQDANTTFLMQRGADNILREIYLNKLIEAKLPDGFPSAEQVQEYYDKNKEKFVIAERVHVWQIFFPIDKTMDKNAVTALRKKVNVIAKDITRGKID